MAKRLTFLGKPLNDEGESYGHPTYRNEVAHVFYSDGDWVAGCLIGGLHEILHNTRGATPQEALDKCEANAIAMFRDIGAELDYEVE